MNSMPGTDCWGVAAEHGVERKGAPPGTTRQGDPPILLVVVVDG